jgi:EAL domain-containing protein (putative c-di-GMP-specific phosphodiesterase class I)/GGDEF domain-containing protein
VWLVLLAVRTVGVRGSRVLVGYWTVAVAALVWCSGGTGLSVAYVAFVVPMAVFVALFLGARAVLCQQAASVVVLGVALARSAGVVHATGLAVAVGLASSVAPAAVLVMTRSARRHGTVDADTGLPNGFGLARWLAANDRTTYVVAVVVLDGVAHAREALGYQVGTELLRRAVEDLGQVLPSDAVIGRVDGDELVVTLALDRSGPSGPSVADPGPRSALPEDVSAAGRALADTLVRAISAGGYLVGEIEISLRACVGLSTAPWDGTDMAELVRRASLTARRAGQSGNTVLSWDGDRGALTADDLALLGDLRRAAERGELSLAYQPQVDGSTGRTRSVEALLRWDSPAHGPVSPGRFVPLAERTGLIDRLTEWVVVEALDAQERWQQVGLSLPVSLNLSAASLPSADLSAWILAQLSQRHLPTSCLTVEVTETAVADPDQALVMLRPLHDRGVRISVDDFGTGFTSLAALPRLPLDELKVDQCFVLRSTTSAADEAIVRTVVELGHRLGLEVVAEGVENEAIVALLAPMGIDLLQGFHFARPMSEVDLLRFIGGPRPTTARRSWETPRTRARTTPYPAA